MIAKCGMIEARNTDAVDNLGNGRNTDNRPIGIFDSGVGGLTVAKQIMNALPNESLVYYGDCLRAPYGGRSHAELISFSQEIISFLIKKDIKALVVACGTISATVFDKVVQMPETLEAAGVPTIGMVDAAVDAALAATKTGQIGVIATQATIKGNAHREAIMNRLPNAKVSAIACPLFVPLAEEAWLDNQVAKLTAKIYLQQFGNDSNSESDGNNDGCSGSKGNGDKRSGGNINIDTLVLGCTHYPLLINSISAAINPNITIIDPAIQIASVLAKKITPTAKKSPSHQFYVSGNKEKFDKISRIALGKSFNAKVEAL